jgi:hypothetical protein
LGNLTVSAETVYKHFEAGGALNSLLPMKKVKSRVITVPATPKQNCPRQE